MVYELTDSAAAKGLFGDWKETLIDSCMQQVMGKLYVVDREHPKSVMAWVGAFAFYAGEPCRELVKSKPGGFIIMVPQNDEWANMIEACFPESAKQVTRYAMKKDTIFDEEHLMKLMKELPEEYRLQFIDGELYDRCKENKWSEDFVSAFESKEAYLEYGLGIVVLKNNDIVAGASSYTSYRDGIEIQVDTREDERRKHLATICCAALILACLRRGLYPSWDAQNLWSVHLAEKLGYEFSHPYTAYEVNDTDTKEKT